MGDREVESEHRVTPLELFLDLVFVFAFTQVTTYLSHHATWGGLLRGMLLLAALWWAWSGYAWLTNALDPEEGSVRLAVLTAIAAMLVASLAAPGAFGRDGVLFGVAFLVVRLLHLALFAKAGRGEHDAGPGPVRALSASIVAPILLVVAGALHGAPRLGLWGVALSILYLGPLVRHMRGFSVSPGHFVERFGLIVIIALGESIVAIGVGAAGLRLDVGVIGGALLGVTVAACLWWSYFDWAIYVGQAWLEAATGPARAEFARDAYSYLHFPMVAGIVLFAFGLKTTLPHVTGTLPSVAAFGLVGGIALYLIAHVVLRLRMHGGLGRGRPAASILLLALLPVATVIPAIAMLSIVAAVCVAMIAYEFLRHRGERAWIRSRRGTFTMEEARVELERRNPNRRRRSRGTAG